MENNMIIYQKYMNFFYYTYDLVKKYPKHERFCLVQEIKNTLISGIRQIMQALNTTQKYERIKILKNVDLELNLLKIYMRISYKYKYITLQHYNTASEQLTEIGKLVGGLLRVCPQK